MPRDIERTPAAEPPREVNGDPAAPGDFELEVVRDAERLESLREPWDALLVATAGSVFAGPDWIVEWLRCFASPGERPCVVTARRDGRLRLVAPLLERTERASGLTVPVLRAPTNPHTPRYAWAHDLAPERALALVLEAAGHEVPWQRLTLDYLDSGDPLPDAAGSGRDGLSGTRVAEQLQSPYLTLRGSWDDYEGSLSRRFRKNNRQARRKLEQRGSLTLETLRGGPGLVGALAEAYRVEQASWKGQAGTAIADHPEQVEFYNEVARRSAARGRFELHLLRIDGRLIAFQYCLALGRTYNLVKVGYEPDYAPFSPGSLIQLAVLERLFEAGEHDCFDMLGTASDWKLRWSSELRPLRRLALYRASGRGRYLYCTEVALRRLVKRVPGVSRLHARLRRAG